MAESQHNNRGHRQAAGCKGYRNRPMILPHSGILAQVAERVLCNLCQLLKLTNRDDRRARRFPTFLVLAVDRKTLAQANKKIKAAADTDQVHTYAVRNMKDYEASAEKLRRAAAEAALIRDLATQKAKRETFDNLHHHFTRLAEEVERAMVEQKKTA